MKEKVASSASARLSLRDRVADFRPDGYTPGWLAHLLTCSAGIFASLLVYGVLQVRHVDS